MIDSMALSNVNSLWGAFTGECLERLGVRQVVISPGSRSTPFTFAFARNPRLEAIPVLDERSASFYALGLARQSGRPVALVCTSGTAVVNFLPAIVEARESGVPLLILTGDRPPEMRQCQSGQTIDQVKVFGSYVNHFVEMVLPEATPMALRYLRQTLAHAVRRCLEPQRGPVHLNCPFRDPLAPEPGRQLDLAFDPATLLEGVAPVASVNAPPVLPALDPSRRGIIVAGSIQPENSAAVCEAAFQLAWKLDWPILCDALGPWRCHPAGGAANICTYDTFLRNPDLKTRLAPGCVLQIGPLPTSKVLRAWLQELDVPGLILSSVVDNIDPGHRQVQQFATQDFSAALASLSAGLDGLPAQEEKPGWSQLWADTEAQTRARLHQGLDECAHGFEGLVVRELYTSLPADARLFLASSMPVRDAEFFAPPAGRGFRVFFNRGANGIDGTLSSALGCCHGGRGVLLTGDLALLHDTNGFLAASRLKGHLTIVLINNNGGGIFEGLPVSRFDPPFEDYFATPQQVDFAALAQAYGVQYMQVGSISELQPLVQELPESGIRLLEFRTDRKRDMAFRQQLIRAAAGN